MQKGPIENTSAVKFAINDGTSNKFSIQAKGSVAIGNITATNPFTMDTNSTTAGLTSGSASFLISGDQNFEKLEIRSSLQPTFTGRNSAGTVASPLATTSGKILFSLAGGGYDGVAWTATNPSLISMVAEELFTPTARGANILFSTTAPGTATRTEKMRVTGSGNVGIGTSTPTQTLEVAGGIKVTSGSQPACNDATRGTFWFTNGGSSNDVMAVCAKVGGVNVWKALW